jgi:HPt (histidine-containing phosphotransfer) domain-containing protein
MTNTLLKATWNQGMNAVDDAAFITSEIFDKAAFIRRNQSNVKLAGEVAQLFRDSLPEYIRAIHVAVAAGDATALRAAAHKLKGSAATLSLTKLSAISGEIEAIAASGDAEATARLLPVLELQCSLALDALTNMLVTSEEKTPL